MASSRSEARSVSTVTNAVSIGISRKVASAMMPVRPIPPAVVQKSSGSSSGPTSCTPFGVRSVMRSTWLAKLPST